MIIPHSQIEFYGDQVRWFVGDVVSLGDRLQVGRIRIRIHGVHSNYKVDIPDEDLPWAQVVASISAGGTNGLGNALGIQDGALVFGIFFIDCYHDRQIANLLVSNRIDKLYNNIILSFA